MPCNLGNVNLIFIGGNMLHKVVFQDNLFEIRRMLDVAKYALSLELKEDIFSKKLTQDILFFDFVLQKLFCEIEPQTQLPDYVDSMHCLYFCITNYINILQVILNEKNDDAMYMSLDRQELEKMLRNHQELADKINTNIADTNVQSESYNMVSQTELSELLNFS